ncbi:MAG: NAD-dependent epimerase/dehydratase family protein [Hyphomicrobiaceae bacterium]
MRILVLGGSGLIGRGLVAALARAGDTVAVLSRSALAAPAGPAVHARIQADIADADAINAAVADFRPQVIVHLAAMLQHDCERDPAGAVASNVVGTVNVFEAARAHGVQRVVMASSIAAYGERHDLMREDDPAPASLSLYGETKRLGELLGQRYQQLHGLEMVALRYSGVIGPGGVAGRGMALARHLLIGTANGGDVHLDFVSGEETCHLTHVDDAVAVTVAAIRHPAPRHAVYNVAGPDANFVSLRDLHAAVRRQRPAAGRASFSGRARSAGPVDTTRLREDLGVTPAVGLADGLAAILASGG